MKIPYHSDNGMHPAINPDIFTDGILGTTKRQIFQQGFIYDEFFHCV